MPKARFKLQGAELDLPLKLATKHQAHLQIIHISSPTRAVAGKLKFTMLLKR